MNGDGVSSVDILETITTLTDNGDNTLTYTNEAGTPVTVDFGYTLVNNGDGTATFTPPNGAPVTLDICAMSVDAGCVTSMVDNGDGTYTFTDEAGTATTIDTATTVTATDNLDGTFTLLDDNGNTVTIDTNDVLTTITNTVIGNKIADYTNEAGTVVAINETITSIVDNGNEIGRAHV